MENQPQEKVLEKTEEQQESIPVTYEQNIDVARGMAEAEAPIRQEIQETQEARYDISQKNDDPEISLASKENNQNQVKRLIDKEHELAVAARKEVNKFPLRKDEENYEPVKRIAEELANTELPHRNIINKINERINSGELTQDDGQRLISEEEEKLKNEVSSIEAYPESTKWNLQESQRNIDARKPQTKEEKNIANERELLAIYKEALEFQGSSLEKRQTETMSRVTTDLLSDINHLSEKMEWRDTLDGLYEEGFSKIEVEDEKFRAPREIRKGHVISKEDILLSTVELLDVSDGDKKSIKDLLTTRYILDYDAEENNKPENFLNSKPQLYSWARIKLGKSGTDVVITYKRSYNAAGKIVPSELTIHTSIDNFFKLL